MEYHHKLDQLMQSWKQKLVLSKTTSAIYFNPGTLQQCFASTDWCIVPSLYLACICYSNELSAPADTMMGYIIPSRQIFLH